MAMDSMLWMSELLAEIFCQLLPPSLLRKTPSTAPATRVLESDAEMAMARIDLPCMAGIVSQVFPDILGCEEQVAGLLSFDAPGGGVHFVRALRIDGEVVDDVVIAAAQVGKL